MSKKKNIIDHSQVSLDFNVIKWPPQESFPLNIKSLGRNVQDVVYPDIENSAEYIVVTGFTSLSNLIDLFGHKEYEKLTKVRILIGFEPNIRGRKKYVKLKLDKEIKDYWLRRGLSIMLGGAVMNLIHKIDKNEVEFKFKDKLHAKIYVGDNYALLGSSNFSFNGLNKQEEANIRVNKNGLAEESNQYAAIKLIAESYYDEATPYDEKMKALLEALIKDVTWQEALARAIAEVLEGHWMDDYKSILMRLEQIKLWPSQWKGIAQAITILQAESNVLIADPTGAGKTKLCTSLILSLKHWLYEIGRNHKSNSMIICPPLVVNKWRDEFRTFNQFDNNTLSMGMLSNAGLKNKKRVAEDLQLANILTIDEAHNYLSPNSNRTNALKLNDAEYKILVTATPISKKVDDLLKLIELLDIDNLSDEDFETYKELLNKPYQKSNEEDIQNLRKFISKFTVRRTKKSLNKDIEREPEKYMNALGKLCRFPKQQEKTYVTQETKEDRLIVQKIGELCERLSGVTNLTSFYKPSFEIDRPESITGYINKRIAAAKALCIYMIRASLRSSHIALIEHIEGSQEAMKLFGFQGKTQHTGDKLKKLNEIIDSGQLPRRYSKFKKEYFPNWLIDLDEYRQVCKNELALYQEISVLAKKLSGQRELGKVHELAKIGESHADILAFDSTVITLYYFKKLFAEHYPDRKLFVASGSDRDNTTEQVISHFNIQSTSLERCIALCSDKMSESIDLQKASAIVLLDLPSVLRIVEQRIGRVDRMDSLHEKIEIYWPVDSEEYAMKTDARLIQTNDLVDDIFGSNFEIPNELKGRRFSQLESTTALIKEYKEFVDKDESWSGIQDSFQSVIDLKEGKSAIITEALYNEFKDTSAEIKTRVSFIGSEKDWCFIALRGDVNRSPRWYFIDSEGNIESDYSMVCSSLRNNLGKDSIKLKWDNEALRRFINIFKQQERQLLPPKKKRALEVAEFILTKKRDSRRHPPDSDTLQVIKNMLDLLHPSIHETVDYERLAEEWIGILQPFLLERRAQNRRKRTILNLSCLKSDYNKINFDLTRLNEIIENAILADEIDSKIASCIIGVSNVMDAEELLDQ